MLAFMTVIGAISEHADLVEIIMSIAAGGLFIVCAWVSPSTRTTGTLITAAIWNQDVVSNPLALRDGAIAMPNQENGRFAVSSSSTQLSANKNAFVSNFMEFYS